MIKLSKKLLFILIIVMPILGTISYTMIDWNVFNSGIRGAMKELRLTLVFFGLGVYFIFPYVRKLKETK
jgi:hypothetical protein